MKFLRVFDRNPTYGCWRIQAIIAPGMFCGAEDIGTLPNGKAAWVERETERLAREYLEVKGLGKAPIEIEVRS